LNLISYEKISKIESRRIRYLLISIAAVSLIFVFYHPLNLINHFFPGLMRSESSCIMLNLTGLRCPFCGMSRSFKELLKLNFAGSFYYNPVSIFVIAFIGSLFFVLFVLSFYDIKIKFNFDKKTLIIFSVVMVIVWILNLMFGH